MGTMDCGQRSFSHGKKSATSDLTKELVIEKCFKVLVPKVEIMS